MSGTGNLTIKVLVSGVVTDVKVPEAIVAACQQMSTDWHEYFADVRQPAILQIDRVVLSRMRPEGLVGAIARMRAAAAGQLAKRKFIDARKLDDDFLVLDGNSTALVLRAIGCPVIPVILL